MVLSLSTSSTVFYWILSHPKTQDSLTFANLLDGFGTFRPHELNRFLLKWVFVTFIGERKALKPMSVMRNTWRMHRQLGFPEAWKYFRSFRCTLGYQRFGFWTTYRLDPISLAVEMKRSHWKHSESQSL